MFFFLSFVCLTRLRTRLVTADLSVITTFMRCLCLCACACVCCCCVAVFSRCDEFAARDMLCLGQFLICSIFCLGTGEAAHFDAEAHLRPRTELYSSCSNVKFSFFLLASSSPLPFFFPWQRRNKKDFCCATVIAWHRMASHGIGIGRFRRLLQWKKKSNAKLQNLVLLNCDRATAVKNLQALSE